MRVYNREGADSLERPIGRYHTLSTGRLDMLSEDEIDECTEEIARKLCLVVDKLDCLPERLLIVGLGNASLTPDSFGPRAAKIIKPTLHIRNFDENMFSALECSEIAVICPGVSAETGIDAVETVKGVAKRTCPDLIMAIDAIATSDENRLGSTIQISDTGLHPGRGIGNSDHTLTEETIGIPIIAIGIPTVIDSRVFRSTSAKASISESMLVAPREIDDIISVGARIVGGAINQAFGISAF